MRLAADNVVDTDVLVIGAGGSGTRATIAAHDAGADVVIVCEGLFTRDSCGGTQYTEITGLEPRDNWKVLFEDMIRSGCFMNDQRRVERHCKETGGSALDLERFGVIFQRTRDGGSHRLITYGGHSRGRTGGISGYGAVKLIGDEIHRRGIRVIEELMITKLLTSKGAVVGAIGFHIPTGDIYAIKSPSVLIATGGSAALWGKPPDPRCACPSIKIGTGMHMVYEAGAELVDMEFFQFNPMDSIPSGRGGGGDPNRTLGGRLYNILGERVMRRYAPDWLENTSRDFFSRVIFREIREGHGTSRDGLWMSYTHGDAVQNTDQPPQYVRHFQRVRDRQGLDLRVEPEEVLSRAHYTMGGIKLYERDETCVPGIYAAGEVAGGVHGGNRLGSNSLPCIFIEGKHAGKNAAEDAIKDKPKYDMDSIGKQVEEERERIYGLLEKEGKVLPGSIKTRIMHLMWDYVGVERDEKGLKHALEEIERYKKDYENIYLNDKSTRYNMDLITALLLPARIDLGEIVARAALMRTESRAAHARLDYPKMDNDNWLCNIIVQKVNGEMTFKKTPVEEYIMTKEEWLKLGYFGAI